MNNGFVFRLSTTKSRKLRTIIIYVACMSREDRSLGRSGKGVAKDCRAEVKGPRPRKNIAMFKLQ
jgi:hypothetical protein